MVAVQYEGCALIVRAYREGKDHADPWPDAQILPGGLKFATPPAIWRAIWAYSRVRNPPPRWPR